LVFIIFFYCVDALRLNVKSNDPEKTEDIITKSKDILKKFNIKIDVFDLDEDNTNPN